MKTKPTPGPAQVENEVRILSSLSHAHIITYHCSFEVRNLGQGGGHGTGRAGGAGWRTQGGGRRAEGAPFTTHCCYLQAEGILNIVMEFASRGTMEEAIQRRQATRAPFAELTVLSWLQQLGGALQHMHEKHVLHRDLKAANVFLTDDGSADGSVKLGDFGISKACSTPTRVHPLHFCPLPHTLRHHDAPSHTLAPPLAGALDADQPRCDCLRHVLQHAKSAVLFPVPQLIFPVPQLTPWPPGADSNQSPGQRQKASG